MSTITTLCVIYTGYRVALGIYALVQSMRDAGPLPRWSPNVNPTGDKDSRLGRTHHTTES